MLVIRDPIKRFMSAITSKYMLPNSQYQNELQSEFAPALSCSRTSYSSADEVIQCAEEIAVRLLLIKPALDRYGSHIRPLNYIFSPDEVSIFDQVIDVSAGKSGFENFRCVVNSFVSGSGEFIKEIPLLNESPLSVCFSDLSFETRRRVISFYNEDLKLFPYVSAEGNGESSDTCKLSIKDLRGANLFYNAVSSFYLSRAAHAKSLANLRNRIDEGKNLYQSILSERNSLVKEKGEAQQAVEELKKQLEAKGGELQKLVVERDARVKEKGEAQQAVEELKKQLEAKGGELQKLVGERDARVKEKGEAQQRVEELKKQLEAKGGELQKVVVERDARAKEKGEAQRAVEQLEKRLEAKGGELQKLVVERDARAKEKGEAQRAVEQLEKRLEAKEVSCRSLLWKRMR